MIDERDPGRQRRVAPRHQRQATMTGAEVRLSLDQLDLPADQRDHDPMTRLAWRPAWSIRSRRGALGPFLDLIRGAVR
ncbi:hypothetical protein KHP62_00625 [Rhodobacteraceae bacterium NNCM2]|nr:hypothetical protein [Coraliihabitans acroporae]